MNRITLILLAVCAVACGGGPRQRPADLPPPTTPMCVLKTVPPRPVKYALVKPLKLGRPYYGGVAPLTMVAVREARLAYADAIINYNGSQRFGFWPWRFIRPVVTGDAVRIDNPEVFDCVKLGGEFYSETAYYGRGELAPVPKTGESDYDRGRREMREQLERERQQSAPPSEPR